MEHEILLRRRGAQGEETLRVWLPEGLSLLDAARRAALPVASACRGESLCARCGLRILSGGAHLPAEEPAETRAKQRNRVDPELRLACQARPTGPVEVTATYW